MIDQIGILNYLLAGLGHHGPDGDLVAQQPGHRALRRLFPDIWLTTSFVALVVFAGLQNIPSDLIEAAKIDGASAVQRFVGITLPLLRPVIAVVLIVRGVNAAKTFDLIWIQTEGGPSFQSEVLSMNIYQRMIRYGDVGEASTSTLFLIAMIVIAIIAPRYLAGSANARRAHRFRPGPLLVRSARRSSSSPTRCPTCTS